MSHNKLQNGAWAAAMILTAAWPSNRMWFSTHSSAPQQSQQSQQDQDKEKKKDKGVAGDSQPAKNSNSNDAPKSGDKPAPLFGGSLNVKSSRQSKDSATLGFNGVDDNGQVQKIFLSANASGADVSAVQKMASTTVNSADLDEFIQQGGLNTNAPAKKSSNPGGKS
jgi:hypothetical protein